MGPVAFRGVKPTGGTLPCQTRIATIGARATVRLFGFCYTGCMSPPVNTQVPMKPLIVTITGPSASGKTVLSQLMNQNGFEPLVSTTTRSPRQGEKDGIHYHFVSHAEFAQMATDKDLIESVTYDGNCYGISRAEAERAFGMGKPAVLVAEPHGVEQIHRYSQDRGWDTLHVFVTNPNEVLIQRILQRFHEDCSGIDPNTPNAEQALQKQVRVHGARIEKVLGFEQENWVKPAREGTTHYDLKFWSFGAENQDEVLGQVIDAAQVRMGNKLPHRRARP